MTGFFVAYLLRLLQFRSAWSLRILSSTVPDVRTVHARIAIRNAHPHGHLPSPDEINAWLNADSRSHKRISKPMIDDAFDSGEEVGVCLEGAIVGFMDRHQSIKFDLIKCIGYDGGIAGLLQG
jgi:hypothetical protein